MIYISKITLKNVRCFRDVSFELNPFTRNPMWSIILGDNGVGKSTLLRSVAIGLSDLSGSYTLLGDLYGEWLTDEEDHGSIEVEFTKHGQNNTPLKISTSFSRGKYGYTFIDQATTPENDFPWDELFICGYGAARRAYGTKDYTEYAMPDAVYTLFNYDAPLQNAELILRRLKGSNYNIRRLLRRIDSILMLSSGSVRLLRNGIFVRGPWGDKTLGALADGYQSIIAMIIDIIGWALFYDSAMFRSDRAIRGIVLIDEIEQHLHPRWQRKIIGLLHEAFPRIQFISTSHSPMCVIGSTDLSDSQCNIVLIEQHPGGSKVLDKLKPPRMRRADQVLTSYLFGLPTASDNRVKHDIRRYSSLLSKKRTRPETRELSALRRRLERALGKEESRFEKDISEAIRQVINMQPSLSKFDSSVMNYELRRQLRDMLSENDFD